MTIDIKMIPSHQKPRPNEHEPLIKKYSDQLIKLDKAIHDVYRWSAFSIHMTQKLTKNDYDITQYTKISIDLHQPSHKLTKKRFHEWVTGNCLTHMCEIFDSYLDVIIKDLQEAFPESGEIKKDKDESSTTRLKISNIMKIISENYSDQYPLSKFTEKELKAIDSIKRARNIIVHENCVVSKNKANKRWGFELGWFYIKDYYHLANGSIANKSQVRKTNIEINDIHSDFGYYCRKYKTGSCIKVSPYTLFRIGQFIMHTVWKIHNDLQLLYKCDPRQIIYK